VDQSLELFPCHLLRGRNPVSILILVDQSLEPYNNSRDWDLRKVSILILVDQSLELDPEEAD